MKSKRIIRKRQFDTTKPLRLFRTFDELFHHTSTENIADANITDFVEQERYENKDKITSMFDKKKANVPIPDINKSDRKDKGEFSDRSAATELSILNRNKDDDGAVEFIYKPIRHLKILKAQQANKIEISEPAKGKEPPIQFSYIKYRQAMTPLNKMQIYDKIDYMITEEHWEEIKANIPCITESMKDFAEEIIDKFEKFTEFGTEKSLEECKVFLSRLKFITSPNPPSNSFFSGIYYSWVSLRKKLNNPLIRIYWKKADPNDNLITACYKLRFPENKNQKKKKHKNNQNFYLKIKALRKEIISGRSLLLNLMKREKLK